MYSSTNEELMSLSYPTSSSKQSWHVRTLDSAIKSTWRCSTCMNADHTHMEDSLIRRTPALDGLVISIMRVPLTFVVEVSLALSCLSPTKWRRKPGCKRRTKKIKGNPNHVDDDDVDNVSSSVPGKTTVCFSVVSHPL